MTESLPPEPPDEDAPPPASAHEKAQRNLRVATEAVAGVRLEPYQRAMLAAAVGQGWALVALCDELHARGGRS